MPEWSAEQLEAARRLITRDTAASEASIQQNLSRLLDALDLDNVHAYRTDRGPADIYLPRRRVLIEVKKAGLAEEPDEPQARENDETPKEQLERYLRSEIERELQMPLLTDDAGTHPWLGILTDGAVWHAWQYAHERGAVGQPAFARRRPVEPEHLLKTLDPLLSREPIGKPWIPADPRSLFRVHRSELTSTYAGLVGKAASDTETKFELWLDMLRTSGMAPESPAGQQDLFVRHSFLVTIARGVIHTLTREADEPDPSTLLADGFVAWILQVPRGVKWARGVLLEIHSWDWRRRRGDVLRPLYEEFVPERQRKVFGEYYTPDWLAEMIVEAVCDKQWCEAAAADALIATSRNQYTDGVGVLDPACGSGTFLYHATRRLLSVEALASVEPTRRANAVVRLVNGIDVHPIATEIARATLLRALPAAPSDGEAGLQIYQGDSLQTYVEKGGQSVQLGLYTQTDTTIRIQTPGGRQVRLPRSFARSPTFGADLKRMTDLAKADRDQPLYSDILHSVPVEDREALNACYRAFREVILAEGNSVWTWYIVNISGPLHLSERTIDRIVANPPWVAMSEIQVPQRKRALEDFADQALDIWTGGKQAPHFDIAAMFIKRARLLYMRDVVAGPAGWLVKKSAMKAGSWAKFRRWHQEYVRQKVDLEAVQPFGGGDARRCCILLDGCTLPDATAKEVALGCAPDRRPEAATPLEEARQVLRVASLEPGPPKRPSDYLDAGGGSLFRQGASISPRVLVVMDRARRRRATDEWLVTTSPSTKEPWSEVEPASGSVPGGWVRDFLSSKQVFPFAMAADSNQALIPSGGDGLLLTDPGARSPFWRDLDETWRQHRSQGKTTPGTLIEQIDFRKKLSRQLGWDGSDGTKRTVLYPKSGDIMRACRGAVTIVNDGLYYWEARSAQEAAYLVALLNAPSLNGAYVSARESGRDFHTHLWKKVPIPRFDSRRGPHRRLASLTSDAETLVEAWLSDPKNREGLGQLAISTRLRKLLREKGILRAIDAEARRILPRHTEE